MPAYFVLIAILGTIFGVTLVVLAKPGKGRLLRAAFVFSWLAGLAGFQLMLVKIVEPNPRAPLTAAHYQIDAYKTALGVYEMDNGFVPSTEQGLQALVRQPISAPQPMNWKGPYLDPPVLKPDPWGHDYIYRYPGTHNPKSFDVYSLGPDGIDGTKDDIGNWK